MGSTPAVLPPLDPTHLPAALFNRSFRRAVEASGEATPLRFGLLRPDGTVSTHDTLVYGGANAETADTLFYAERLLKTLLWQRGANRVLVAGPEPVVDHLTRTYSPTGRRKFDVAFMTRVYDEAFRVESTDPDAMPPAQETRTRLGRHQTGHRIGFDLGASDYKVSAVSDGEVVWAAEFPWQPSAASDIDYHHDHIRAGLEAAASHLPRVDAIGGSAAGVWINDQVRVASLFRGLTPAHFETGARNLFHRIRQEWQVPLSVINDGEVTALAGSMSLEANAVLGIAMGSSQAAGYVTRDGSITNWLNELAFAPIDFQPGAPVDEWSGDSGCGAQYFCQSGVIRLAERAGIELDDQAPPAERLSHVQLLLAGGDTRVAPIYETIGVWLGYAVAHYADFYDIDHVLVLGRVTTGDGGEIIAAQASSVLSAEFPDLSVELHLPDERMKRVGQSVAAASLPELAREEAAT